MSPISRLGKSLILASVAVVATSGVAYASDEVVDNIDAVSGNSPGQINLAATGSQVVKYKIVADGACDASVATPATVVLSANPSAGLSISPSTLSFTSCNTEQNVTYTGQNATNAATVHAVTAQGTIPALDNNNPNKNLTEQDARLTVNVAAAASNPAPTVSVPAADAFGTEGDTLSTTGTFADNAAFASITPSSTVGTFSADLATGVWTWSLATTDDVTQEDITVTATDAGGLTATDTFSYRADNADPVVGAVGVTQTGACSINVSAPFSDVGSGDTHSSTIDWGDTSADTVDDDPAANPVTGSHTYTANGTYTVRVTVVDDNGGSDYADAEAFATQNTASAIMQPINTNGTRSSFKIGQTIPVKITVTGCDGAAVTSLTPTVTLYKLDGVPNPGDVESPASTVATNGLQMRWSDTLYIYNLSTKLSQQYGTALTAGSYRVSVDDASFYSRTTADFELRK